MEQAIETESIEKNKATIFMSVLIEIIKRKICSVLDTSEWGKNGAKTVEDLVMELLQGESTFEIVNQLPIRKVRTSCAYIYYKTPEGKILQLKEVKQIMRNEVVRSRSKMYPISASEKIKEGETPLDAIHRGTKSEIGLENLAKNRIISITNRTEGKSNSYPGLESEYTLYDHVLYFNKEEFNPEGYKGEPDESGIISIFEWREAGDIVFEEREAGEIL